MINYIVFTTPNEKKGFLTYFTNPIFELTNNLMIQTTRLAYNIIPNLQIGSQSNYSILL